MELLQLAAEAASLAFERLDRARSASEGIAALQAMLAQAKDRVVVLLDLQLPDMSGLEVVLRIRAEPLLAHVPVVVLSHSSDDADLREAYRCGANAYVVKPSSVAETAEMLKGLNQYWGGVVRVP